LHIVAGGLDLCCGRVLLIRLNVISAHIDIAHQLAYLADGAEQHVLIGEQKIDIGPAYGANGQLLLWHSADGWRRQSLSGIARDQRQRGLLAANDLIHLAGQFTQMIGNLALTLPDLTQLTLVLRLVELLPILFVFVLWDYAKVDYQFYR